jgi:hypothetical protein
LPYATDEATFELPELGFEDRTVHVLARRDGEGEVTITVERGRLKEGATVLDFARASAARDARTVESLVSLAEREVTCDGVPGLEWASRFRAGALVYQRRVHLVGQDRALAITLRGPFETRAELDAWMDHVLASIQFR